MSAATGNCEVDKAEGGKKEETEKKAPGSSFKALQLDGSASLPGSFLPNGIVFSGPKTVVVACTNQNVWNGISKWMCISKPPMGLIAVLRPIMEDSGHYYSLVSHVTVEEPCTAIEFDDKTAMVYVGQQDGLVEVYKLDSADSLTRDWGFTAHSLDVTGIKLVGVERQTLVTCGLDKLLRVYDVAQRNFVAEVEVGGAGIACLMTEASYFLDDVEALVGSFDGNVYGITLKSKDGSIYAPRVVKKLPGMHTGSVQCMTTTAAQTRARKYCGKRRTYEPKLFTGSFDTTVGHWLKATAEMKESEEKENAEGGKGNEENGSSGTAADEFEGVKFAGKLCGHSATVRSLVWLGEQGGGGELLTGGADGLICQYRLETYGYRPTSVTKAHAYTVMHMVWDGDQLITASDDSTIKTWSFKESVASVPRGYV